MSRDHASAEERFRCLYAEHVDPILGFAMRRADQADDAADIGAETFLVAWRRIRRGTEPGLIASSAG
jgi:DNA-directed RNA polymerase specialized sigma24 family protein